MPSCSLSFLVLVLLLASPLAWANGDNALIVEGAIGRPSVTLTNPDNSKAGYTGVSLEGRVLMPVMDSGNFKLRFAGLIRYHDLENVSSTDSTTESANHIGPGLGLAFQFGKISFGYDYSLMAARHFYISKSLGNRTVYEYSVGNMSLGYSAQLGKLGFGVSYGMASASIPGSATGMTTSSKYEEQTFWLRISYDLGTSLGQLASELTK